MLALAVFGFGANLAVSITTERVSNPGRPLTQYVKLQERISRRTPGDPFVDRIKTTPTLPHEGHADDIMIVGDCDAVFVATGESLDPWSMLEARSLEWTIDLSNLPDQVETLTLAVPDDLDTEGILLDVQPDGHFRARFQAGRRDLVGQWRGTFGREAVTLRLLTVPHLLLTCSSTSTSPAEACSTSRPPCRSRTTSASRWCSAIPTGVVRRRRDREPGGDPRADLLPSPAGPLPRGHG